MLMEKPISWLRALGITLIAVFAFGMLLLVTSGSYRDVQATVYASGNRKLLRDERGNDKEEASYHNMMANHFNPELLQQYVKTYCPGRPNLIPMLKHRSNIKVFDEVTLIITFNFASFYGVIPLIEVMYRRTFKSIIYCGRGFSIPNYNVTFLTISDKYEATMTGSFMFECMNKAIDLNTNTKGYLLIGDDTLFYPWTWTKDFDDNKVWVTQPGIAKYHLRDMCWSHITDDATYLKYVSKYPKLMCKNTTKPWEWWKHYYKGTVQAYRDMEHSKDLILKKML